MKVLTILGGVIVAGVAIGAVGLALLNRAQGDRSVASPDLAAGRLAPCPESPNCVSTQAPESDDAHAVEPIPYRGDQSAAVAAIVAVLEAQPRTVIVERGAGFVRAQARSAVFGFVDDVDFWVPAGQNVVHMRSASRVGQGDMGVNRRRYRRIRAALEERMTS